MKRLLTLLCLLLPVVAAAPASAGTYYVRKTGNDTTGDGSDALPWLTVSKAITTVAIGGNHTINIGDGTYEEDTGGLGYLMFNRAFGATVTIQSESGNAAGVELQSATSVAYNTRCLGCAKLTFRNLTFGLRTVAIPSSWHIPNGSANTLTFEGVTFEVAAAVGVAANFEAVDAQAISTVSLTNTTISQVGSNAVRGIQFNTSGTGTISGVTVNGLTATLQGASSALWAYRNISNIAVSNVTASNTGNQYVLRFDGITTGSVTNVTARSTGAPSGAPLIFGVDGAVGLGCTGITISNANLYTDTSHGMLIGASVNGATATGLVVRGGDQGIVVKVANDVTITGAIVSHTGGTGLYAKGASNVIFQDSTVLSFGGYGIGIFSEGANVSSNVTYRRNRVSARGAAVAFSWPAASDGGGNVVDSNIYSLCGSGNFGAVLATANIATLSALRVAWDAYGAGTNDENSRMARSTFSRIGRGGLSQSSIADCPDGFVGGGPGIH
jgi:hypothetical protein